MSMFLHPVRLEEDVAQAAAELRAGLVSRRLGVWSEAELGPLVPFRRFLSRERFEQLSELPDGLPNRESLQRWMACLIIERVTWDDRASAEVARRNVEHGIDALGAERWSVRSLALEVVRTNNDRRRAVAAEGLTRVAQRASDEAIWWLRRRQAAALELGLDGLTWLEGPWQGVSTTQVSELVMEATDELAAEMLDRASGWHEALWLGAAMDAREGWPAHLTPQWFRAVFGNWTSLTKLRIEPGPLQEPICGASFTRALVRFGTAVYRACADRTGGPFSLTHRPFDAAEASYGALFGLLLISTPFLRRRLGLGTPSAREQVESMARSMLVAVRLDAARALFSSQTDVEKAVEAHANAAARALKTSLPDEMAGVVPRYDPRASARLAGALRAVSVYRELVETFDEDWFDNPRAHEFVAALDVTERLVLDKEAIQSGARLMGAMLGEAYAR